MRQGLVALKASASSGRWLSRQSRDPFVRDRDRVREGSKPSSTTTTYRSRSSFKLLSLADKYPVLLSRGSSVVDLGAAPGGWSQVAVSRVRPNMSRGGHVVAVDILGMHDLPGVQIVKGDFLSPDVQQTVHNLITHKRDASSGEVKMVNNGKVDTVLSDMMAPMAGVKARDTQASLDLVSAATSFAHAVLKPGGSLVLKFFLHPDLLDFRKAQLDPSFDKVHTDKPKASRSESSEAYWVCLGYRPKSTSST